MAWCKAWGCLLLQFWLGQQAPSSYVTIRLEFFGQCRGGGQWLELQAVGRESCQGLGFL